MKKLAGYCSLLLVLALPARAGDLLDIAITHDGDRYTISMDALLLTRPNASWDVMRDYKNLPAINNSIHQTTLLAHNAAIHTSRVASVVKVCVWFFCRELQQTQDMRATIEKDHLLLTADIIPAQSDFKSGHGRWQFMPHPIGTRMLFNAELEPDFWIPPLIGPWLIKRKMHAEALETIAGIETAVKATQQPNPQTTP